MEAYPSKRHMQRSAAVQKAPPRGPLAWPSTAEAGLTGKATKKPDEWVGPSSRKPGIPQKWAGRTGSRDRGRLSLPSRDSLTCGPADDARFPRLPARAAGLRVPEPRA